jgi:hypothetical protein
MGIPLVRGRAFTPADRFGEDVLTSDSLPRPPGVAIINEAMARRYWPGADPLGTAIFLPDDEPFAAYRTVVGVVGDVRAEAVDAAAAPTVFLPYAQNPGQSLSLVLRSDLPPGRLVGPVRRRLRAIDSAITIANIRPFDDVVGGAVSRPRFTMLLAGGFATLALGIAGVGVSGIVGFLVARRTQELGIRVALGARPADVVQLVLAEGLRPVLLGMLAGAAGAVAAAGAMRALLYAIAPLDGVSFSAAALLLGAASLAAAAMPARRAARADALRSLRSE